MAGKNPIAKALRSPHLAQRVVADKRRREAARNARRDMRGED